MNAQVFQGDALHLAGSLASDSIDAVITDPPYGLKFMGKDWDHGIPGQPFWEEFLRTMKPGAHLLAFGGTRTHHRLMVAIEDAGFEIRDCLMWLYGSGFPKSLNVSKAIDATILHGGSNTRRLKQTNESRPGESRTRSGTMNNGIMGETKGEKITNDNPATDLAQQWDGWGTALKPAWEPIILARKPLVGTVAANVTAHGTGALNIDGCRIGTTPDERDAMRKQSESFAGKRWGDTHFNYGYESSMPVKTVSEPHAQGRWPANVALDEDAATMLDEMSGTSKSTKGKPRRSQAPGDGYGMTHTGAEYNDIGGASRFFYTAKASRKERNAGLDGMPERHAPHGNHEGRDLENPKNHLGGLQGSKAQNFHPTVKPITLMRWLCRLVTPPGGTILDPFNGSGSTGCAAVLEGFRYLGFELDQDFVDISIRRIDHWTPAS